MDTPTLTITITPAGTINSSGTNTPSGTNLPRITNSSIGTSSSTGTNTPFMSTGTGDVYVCRSSNRTWSSLTPTILADSDRDGVVSEGDWDDRRSTWSEDFGALFLPNIGQTPPLRADDIHVDGDDLHITHNATGDELLNPEFAAPLRTVPLRKLSAGAVGRLLTSAPSFVRLFCQTADTKWVIVTEDTRFSKIALANGLILAIDGRTITSDFNTWDGTVTVYFDVHDTGSHSGGRDKETPSYLENRNDAVNGTSYELMRQIMATTARTGVPVKRIPLENPWLRDHMSVGYCSMPGRCGIAVTIRVLLLLPNEDAPANAKSIYTALCGPSVAIHHIPTHSTHSLGGQDSGGNIDVIPPYTSRAGIHWPNGRILMLMGDVTRSQWSAPAPALGTLLASQGDRSQGPPLYIHADITAVGHMDEILTFVPDPRTPLGFTVAIIDPRAGLELLRDINDDGHGYRDVPAFPFEDVDFDRLPKDKSKYAADSPPEWRTRTPCMTIEELLRNKPFINANEVTTERVELVLAELLEEVPIDPANVLRLPVLVYPHPLESQKDAVDFLLPNPVNGVVLGRWYLAPKQWGPVSGDNDDDGSEEARKWDAFRKAVDAHFGKVRIEVIYNDDFLILHIHDGDIHCATNTYRG